jgi:LuxR family transcriptional regulator, maltose regulon positive regulatory protein
VRAQLPLPWVVEIAVAAHAAGSPGAVELLDSVGAAQRPWLRRLAATASPQLARAAKALLGQQPTTPDHTVEIRVLGPLELSRDGQPVDHPDLRRERVRQLLQYLVVHGPTNRTTVGAELWPDLSPDAAARNLRVTLSYLLRALEPDKEDGAPSAYLQTEGGGLGLRVGEHLTVDLHRFEAELDAAARAERMASPSMALRHLALALPWYRGDCLTDLVGSDWADLERERIRVRYVAAAVRAGDLLLATGDVESPLRLALDALRADAFSEVAFGLLVAVRLDRGETDAARSAYRRLVAMLRELGLPATRRTQLLARRLESPRGHGPAPSWKTSVEALSA